MVVSTRDGVPVRISDVATRAIGGEIRTGSASENGREVVDRHGVDADRQQQPHRRRSGRCQARPGSPHAASRASKFRRCSTAPKLVDATIETVATNLGEGALLVILVLFALLGNFRAALITALVIPLAMLMTAAGMLQGRISANLMSLGALDFGLIVDGAVIISGEHPATSCRTAGGVRPSALAFRATADGSGRGAKR